MFIGIHQCIVVVGSTGYAQLLRWLCAASPCPAQPSCSVPRQTTPTPCSISYFLIPCTHSITERHPGTAGKSFNSRLPPKGASCLRGLDELYAVTEYASNFIPAAH